nr:hypothetical protein [Tanacetum cinerariifolium]
MRTRTNRSVGRPTAAVIRRTWRFRPSLITNSSQLVGTLLRKRTGGSRGQSCGSSSCRASPAEVRQAASWRHAGVRPCDQLARVQRVELRAHQIQRGNADLQMLSHGTLIKRVGRTRQFDLAVQRFVGHAQQRPIRHAQAATAVPDHQPAMRTQHGEVISDVLGVGRTNADVDQRHAMAVFGNQVVSRHLITVPDHAGDDGLGFAVIHALVDDDVARQDHLHETRIIAQFFQPMNDELVNVAVVVGQQNPRLDVAPVAAGVVHQTAQREIDTGGVEQRERQRIGIGPVGHKLFEQIFAERRRVGNGDAVGARQLHLGISARGEWDFAMAVVSQADFRIAEHQTLGGIGFNAVFQVALERLAQGIGCPCVQLGEPARQDRVLDIARSAHALGRFVDHRWRSLADPPLYVELVAGVVRAMARQQEACQALVGLGQGEKGIAHRRRAEPFVPDQFIGLAGARLADRIRARGVGAHIGATLLLGHGHADGCTGLVGDADIARVVLGGEDLRQPRLDPVLRPTRPEALRPFLQRQVDAVKVDAVQRRRLIGDLMGLGKLMQVDALVHE